MNTIKENQKVALKLERAQTRKRMSSMLDRFTEQLLQMDNDKKTLNEMMEWLKTQEINTADSTLSDFLTSRRRRREVEAQLDGEKDVLVTVQQWHEANPNPSLEAVMERLKMLAINLSVQKEADPEVLRLAERLAGTASRVDYRTRKLVMEEAKHAEWVKCEQARGFEFCLREAKKYPAVVELYQVAFEALEKCRKENGE
ncbi:MAG TPA: hypothetical protein VG347_02290 [Verrucomicrobiae bacterium]|nr:hypothetical protein [Verrucomicrobiae bacterium]